MAALLTGRARLCVVGVLVGWLAVPGLPNGTSKSTPYSVLLYPSRGGELLGTVPRTA